MILITGASGQVGNALSQLLPDARLLTRQDLDLARPEGVAARLHELSNDGAITYDALINCAAYTAVDAAETDEETALTVNAASVGAMAGWAGGAGVPFVTYSTDYVFDGTADRPYVEADETNPQSAYGRTKRAGEIAAFSANPQTLIIRTAWVISGTHRNFVSTILGLVRDQAVKVVDDQRGSPTIASDLATHTLNLLSVRASGIVHATNRGETTWYGLARRAVELAGLEVERVTPCTTDEFPRPAPRPANSVLHSVRQFDVPAMPLWIDSLPAVVSSIGRWG